MKPGRNAPCACGSGKKYKNCCMGKAEPYQSGELNYLDILFGTGRYAELESCARILLDRRPDAGIVWKMLGLSLQMQGKDALTALHRAAELLPQDAEAHANLAGALRAIGKLDEAAESGRLALQIRPEFAEAHNNLGLVLKDLGQPDDAAASFRRALQIKPAFIQAHNNLGSTLRDLGQLDEAASCYRRALQIKPDFAPALVNLGVILRDLGNIEGARECYLRALELDPKHHEVMLYLGSLCMESGEMAEAETLFRRVLEINPDNLEARFVLAQIGKVKPGDGNLAALVAVEQSARTLPSLLSGKDAISLHFTLGKCFDDIGDYDRAFPHFAEGCRLKRATLDYGADSMTQRVDDIIRIFDGAAIASLGGGGDPSRAPIFVLGMPRSGTTLVEQIISSHPDVCGAGELSHLLEIAQRDPGGAGAVFPANLSALERADLSGWGRDYVARLRRHAPDAQRITDKMPENFFVVGLIHVMLPNAKIIHVRRNPVDTCFSCFTTLFINGLEQTYDLTELGRYYADYARLMEHWRTVLPDGAFLEVRYEDIVADQESQARRLIGYCDLEWNEACIDFHNNKRMVSTASYAQVRRPIYKSAVERWRPYEKFLGPLLDALGDRRIR
ncbi:MAG: sulfotransferase [Nitrosomonadales bacterium]|nr:sulfotransferase [Nitrosomonadales bacterium]